MTTYLKVAGFYTSSETATDMERTLGRIKGVEIVSFGPDQQWSLREKVEEVHPDVAIVEIDGHAADYIATIEAMLEAHRDSLAVYATYKKTDIETTRQLMHAGVRDMFPQPLQPQTIVQEFTRLITERRMKITAERGGRGAITAFINAKGGCGATTVGLNTAQILAARFNATVAFIDLDIQFGAAAMLLDLKPRTNIMEALLKPERIDAEFLGALMTPHATGVHVLASPADLSPLGGISAEAAIRLIGAASESYDYVIVDVPRILTAWTLAALRQSDPIMMVLQNNLSAIRDAKLLLDRLSHEGIDLEKIELVNNRAMSSNTSIDIPKLKDTVGKERLHRVRNDYKTALHAQDQGRPLAEVSESSPLVKDIMNLASYLAGLRGGQPKKRSFLERLLG